MKTKNLTLILTAFLLIGFTACNKKTGSVSNANMETKTDSVAVALGQYYGKNISQQFSGLNPELIAKGIIEGFNDADVKVYDTPEATNAAISGYLQEEKARVAETNKAEGEAFLAKNSKKNGIIVTESGLQYEVIKEGDGEKPTANNTVKVDYTGTTIDGKVFDSSVQRGQPASFPVKGVIKGWTEGLQLMTVGSKYKFYIPSDLAYGERGSGAKIGPNATLIFEVELLEIVK